MNSGKKLDNQALRLKKKLDDLDVSPYQFSKDLGFKSPDTIYHILHGKNKISQRFILNLRKSKYNINPEWLLYGQGEELLYSPEKVGAGREYFIGHINQYPAKMPYSFMKNIARAFAKAMYIEPDDRSYLVKVRISIKEGLEFEYTTYNFYDETMYIDKCYSIIIQPDWEVVSFFDFWRVNEPSRRCDNLFKIKGVKHELAKALQPILDELKLRREAFEESRFLNLNDPFKEIYRTDSRIKTN